jgi:16S rRNA (adenine1518-N6/adenine1519-N6)-dimethyltransferase
MSTLEALGASPRKSFGQNFLHDENLARRIVEYLELSPRDHVIEIGPGLGALTEEIVRRRVSATLLEKDRLFADFLRQKFSGSDTEVIEGDALCYDARNAFLLRPVKVLGNLPYYMSSQLIFHFCAEPSPFDRMVFTLQKEMADRLAAGPGSKDYGSVSIIIQSRWSVEKLRTLPPSVFVPRPQVDSVVILLTPRPLDELTDCQKLGQLVKLGFSERRKQLRKLLAREGDVEAALESLHLPATARAEELSLQQWKKLTNLLAPLRVKGTDQQELLAVVDADDRPAEPRDRVTIHRDGLLHRAVHIFILNREGDLFLQKRSHRKDRFPDRWDSSAAGHVDAGESYNDCAHRELKEELGIAVSLVECGRVPASARTDQEFISIYSGIHEGPLSWNPYEIETGGFFRLEMIDRWIEERPADFADGFLECYRTVRKQLGQVRELALPNSE